MRLYSRSVILIFLLLLIIPTYAGGNSIPQFASTGGYRVTKTADTNDGTCNSDCSLREAIIAANASTGLNPIVYIPNGTYTLTLTGANEDAAATGDLDITRPMNIIGEGRDTTIIDANGTDRAFEVHGTGLTTQDEGVGSTYTGNNGLSYWNDAQFVLSDVTIQNGSVNGGDGGGIRIYSTAPSLPRVILTDVVIQNSSAEDGGGLAVKNIHLHSDGLRLIGNTAMDWGGGLFVDDSDPVYTYVAFYRSLIQSNSALLGGGAYLWGDSTYINYDYGLVEMLQTAIVENTAYVGGGIYFRGTHHWYYLTISTISGNQATNNGGGIYNDNSGPRLEYTTITNNTADADSNGSGNGGGIYRNGGAIEVDKSILYGNIDTGNEAPECSGTVSIGGTVLGNMAGCSFTGGGNTTGQDPMLLPLADNGGDTLTHALSANSPVIGTSWCAIQYDDIFGYDQRGVSWVGNTWFAGVNCEPGAYAYMGGLSATEIAPVPYVMAEDSIDVFVYLPRETVDYAPFDKPLNIVTYEPLFNALNSTTHPAELDNPANYRLLLPGADNTFQTSTCAAILNDDIDVGVRVVRNNNENPKRYYLSLIPADDFFFSQGLYRLIICDKILDVDGAPIDGNADGLPGGDAYFDIDFAYQSSLTELFVTTTEDVTDGVCNSHCSLRDAVRVASSTWSDSRINLPAGTYNLSLVGADEDEGRTGDLDLMTIGNITIRGAGADVTIIDGQGADRIFHSQQASLRFENLTLRNGSADEAGAVRANTIEFINTNILNNSSDTDAAAFAYTVRSYNSTFSGNNGGLRGSAISGSNIQLYNSTVSGNTGTGGAIFYASNLELYSSTIANNSSGVLLGEADFNPHLEAYSTIFSNNDGVNCGIHPNYPTTPAPATSGRFNVLDDSSCNFGTRNLYNTDPLLMPLAYNGGATQTHALMPNSPARNVLRYPECDTLFDQHGNPRNTDGLCNIGAFEGEGVLLSTPTNLTITGTNDTSVSLSWTDTPDETSYRIERSNNGLTGWSLVGSTAVNATTFTDNTAACNTTYHYRIQATNGSNFSVYSNTVSDSTITCSQTGPVFTVITNGGTPGDGCRVDYCSFEAAIEVADADEGESIVLPAGNYGAGYYLSHSIHIIGAGAGQTIFDGQGSSILFTVADSAPDGISLTLDGVTLQNGYADGVAVFPDTQGKFASITVRNSYILYNVGDATIFYSPSADDIALTFENVAISHNVSERNGLILLNGASASTRQLVIRDSVISETTTTAPYGVGFAKIATNGYELVIEDSAFVGNSGDTSGSLFEISGSSNIPIEITNSTFSWNTSIYTRPSVADISGTVNLVMTHNTITQNTGTEEVFLYNPGGTRSMTVFGNIFAGNEGEDLTCRNIISLGYNIFGNIGCSFTPHATDIQTTEPLLSENMEYKGSFVHAPQSGSPALNAIPAASCTLTIDQVGTSRPRGSGCDIGALEVDGEILPAPTNLTVTNTTATSITLSWTDTVNETGYRIERANVGSSNWTQIGTTAANVNIFTNSNLTCNTGYQYRVRATNGTIFSAYSNTANGSTLACLTLVPPTNLTATLDEISILLNWTDTNTQETGYRIEHSMDGVNWQILQITGANVTGTEDYTDVCGVTVYYRAAAVNDTAGQMSAYTSVVSRATAPCPSPLVMDINVADDIVDANPGNGVCLTSAGYCTLRAAIMEANAYPGTDVIRLGNFTHNLTIQGRDEDNAATGDLDITDDLVIIGSINGASTINANDIDRVFDIYAPTAMQYMTIRDGAARTAAGGGIRNFATGRTPLWTEQDGLYLDNVVLTSNTADSNGGGIANYGYFMLLNSRVVNNLASVDGGGIAQQFFDDPDGVGWSVIYSTTIEDNIAVNRGGGLFISQGDPASEWNDLRLWNLTINNNHASFHGGGIAIMSVDDILLDTVTISGNHANRNGGGIYTNAIVTLERSTITANIADLDNNGSGFGGALAIIANSSAYARINHTILSGNYRGNQVINNCYDDIAGSNPPSLQVGYSLLGTLGNCTYKIWGAENAVNPPENNILTDNPMLLPLADNGGLTKTHALQAGSPAINAGYVGRYSCLMVAGDNFTWDQRGVERLGACDMGAYEYTNPAAADVTTLFATMDYITPLPDGYVFTSVEDEPLNSMTAISRRMVRQDVYAPSTSSITHPDSMRLIRGGANGVVDTNSCSGVTGDDVLIPDSFAGGVGYFHAVRTATNLPNGVYRLIICGNVVDVEGIQIDGDNNGTAGGNFIYNFRVAVGVGLTRLQNPSNFSVTGSTVNSITLQWTDNNSAETGYRIERSTDNRNWQTVTTTGANATTFSDTGLALPCGTAYFYRVYAVNTATGVISSYSNVGHRTVCPIPSAPTLLSVTGTTLNTVSLQWTDNASDETGFIVQRSDNSGTSWVQVGTTNSNSTTFTDTGLWCATGYRYRVAAVISTYGTQSAYSNQVTGTTQACPPAPNPPTGLSVTGTTPISISLQWTDNASDETGFVLQRSSDGTIWADYVTLPANTISYIDMVDCGTTQHYRVYAVNQPYAPSSAMSNSVNGSSQPCPLAPTNLSATLNGDSVTLAWIDNSMSETAYLLERSVDGGATWEVITLAADATDYVDAELTCYFLHKYRVRTTVSDIIYSPYTNIVSAVTECAPPIAPTNLTVTDVQRNYFSIAWEDNSNVESQYIVEYSPDNATWNTAFTLPANTETMTHGNLVCNTERYVRVRALRTPELLYSNYTDVLHIVTLPCPPLVTPNAPIVTALDRIFVTLSFTPDNSGEVDNWLLQKLVNGNWQTLATLPVTTTQYIDNNLVCETTHTYRLGSYRAEDNSYSAYSAETVATTANCPEPFETTVGLYRNGQWLFSTMNERGASVLSFRFGPNESGWTPLVGDWDGDGVDGIGIYRNGRFILRNTSDSGTSDESFYFGAREAGWQPIVGDWNGDGRDTVGVYKAGQVLLTDNHTTRTTDYRFRLGDGTAGWFIIAGDWDYSGADSLGLYRGGLFYLTNRLDGSGLTRPFRFGPSSTDWQPLVGDWNADGVDSIGVYRQSVWRLRNDNSTGGVDNGFNFGARESGWIALASYRGGTLSLAALASAPNVIIDPEREMTPLPTEIVSTPEVTVEVTPVEITPLPTTEPSSEVTVEPTTEPTAEPTIEAPVPVEVTPEAQAEVTETVTEQN